MLTSSPGMSCEEELPPLPQAVCLKALDCTLKQAPGCFQWQLKRILERGGMGYVPTGLMGFKDRFCRGYKKPGASAEEAVDYWMHSCDDSTIRKVLLFANDKHNLKLVQAYHETLVGELTEYVPYLMAGLETYCPITTASLYTLLATVVFATGCAARLQQCLRSIACT